MKATSKAETTRFSAKGQVVIPLRLRKEFGIADGTRAMVYADADAIVLKPITAQHYRRLRGSLKHTRAMEVFMAERRRGRKL